MMCRGGATKLALAAPRGSGKTSLTETSVVWALLYGHCRYIVVIGANSRNATNIITNIKRTLTQNKALRDDFPESIYPFYKLNGSALLARGQQYLGELTDIAWNKDGVIFAAIPGSKASGAMLYAVGIKGAVRGGNKTKPDGDEIERPDIVVLDDPQTEAVARSPKQIDALVDIIDGAISGLVGPAAELKMIMLCTVIEENDLSSRYLSHKQWKGLKFKMVEQMPTNMKLWEQYRDVRNEGATKAKQFYKKNLAAMREGAIVPWAENFPPECIDALQHAMNIWSDNEITFYNEYQNTPVDKNAGTLLVPAKTIRTRLNGLERRVVPMDTFAITSMLDVHDDMIYYMVCAWANDFTGYVIDYGVFPEQNRVNFSRSDKSLMTLARQFGEGRRDGAIAAGLEFLLHQLTAESYTMHGDHDKQEVNRIDKILIDSGYKPHVVEAVITKIGSPVHVRPALGVGIGAKQTPMEYWGAGSKGKSAKVGHFWVDEKIKTRAYRTVKGDVNYWKTAVHNAFSLRSGERGSITFWGTNPEAHRMVSEQMTAEKVVLVEANGRKVNEWANPFKQDNHWFDCLVGCMIAASTLGVEATEYKIQ